MPGIISGSTLGRLTGEWLRHYVVSDCYNGAKSDYINGISDQPADISDCNPVRPGTYAMIGAAAMLGGTTRMTVSLCVIVLETTNDIQYLLPVMLTLIVSKAVGDRFNISLYDMHVEVKCIPFLEHKPPVGMEQLHAGDVMVKPVICFEEISSAQDVFRRLSNCAHNGFPVVRQGTDKFIGMITRSQLVVLFRLRAFCGPQVSQATVHSVGVRFIGLLTMPLPRP
eukprot:SAG31_NODE_1017_length_10360_cov_35.198811_9_plen_225_part_00